MATVLDAISSETQQVKHVLMSSAEQGRVASGMEGEQRRDMHCDFSKLREQLTVIISTSATQSNPSTLLVEVVASSFRRVSGLSNCRKVIVCDGFRHLGKKPVPDRPPVSTTVSMNNHPKGCGCGLHQMISKSMFAMAAKRKKFREQQMIQKATTEVEASNITTAQISARQSLKICSLVPKVVGASKYRQGLLNAAAVHAYDQYITRLRTLIENGCPPLGNSGASRTQLLVLPDRRGFGHALKAALNLVKTPYVMVVRVCV